MARPVTDIRRARRQASEPALATRLGRLVEWSNDTGVLVDFDGNARGPIAARSLVPLDAGKVARAVAAGREVLLAFDGDLPIVVGLVEPPPGAEAAPDEAVVDGRRVVLEGKDEIVLKCGAASITLRRNGRVVVRGAYVETRAEGVNRIKGGAVKIN